MNMVYGPLADGCRANTPVSELSILPASYIATAAAATVPHAAD